MKMIKTPYKYLFITENGTAWRNDVKKEIKPTKNGKIRFNGKLYDLQKLTNRSLQNKQTKNIKVKEIKKVEPIKAVSIRELQKQGYKKTKISGLYLTKTGLCYNTIENKNISINNGKIRFKGKYIDVAKIMIETFLNIPIRSGAIIFKNSIDADFNIDNLEYKNTIKQIAPLETDVINCIRMYFNVEKKFSKYSFLYKYYLYLVILKRNFNKKYSGLEFDLFIEYSKNDFYTSNNQLSIFRKFNFTQTNGKNAINKYMNLLIKECLNDFENGILKIKDFAPQPQTKTQRLKQLQNLINEFDLKIKIPLRKPSLKEILKSYQAKSNEIKNM